MSHTYRASANLPADVREELARLQKSLNDAQPEFVLQVLHEAPAKTRPGTVVMADGTDWNPGSGAGVYVRNAANSAWVLLG